MDTKPKTKTKKDLKEVVNEEAEALKAQLARTLADYDNLVKRTQREKVDLFKIISVGVMSKFLVILDNLENANSHLKDSGLAITIGEFKRILSDEGLTEIKPDLGSIFDEETMEAIEIVTGEVDNTVSEVVLTGWKYSDNTMIRHAKVKVVKKN